MSWKRLARRLIQIALVLLGISFITFALVMLSPGDPVRQMIAGNEDIVVSQQELDALRAELGLLLLGGAALGAQELPKCVHPEAAALIFPRKEDESDAQ